MDDFYGYSNIHAQTNEPINLKPDYNRVSETVRRLAPGPVACAVFCGGRRCKYENGTRWNPDSQALNGLFSHWITDDVLAMSRPNRKLMEEFDLLGQFETAGIKSVINLQKQGEHASCSPEPLLPSGFSYDPGVLMENGIYFYNYAWTDYGDASLAHLLDMVKVLTFSVSQGKVAVHCHAGLGRTGVLIACYLVYASRLRANEAVRTVRNKRPGSIQSRLHILCVQQFEQFILPNCMVFCNRELWKDKKIQDFTLQQYLKRQRFILHGKECKTLRLIPKVMNLVCERLLSLCGRPNVHPVQIEEDEPLSPLSSLPPGSPPELSPEVEVTPPSAKTITTSVGLTEPLYKAEEVVRALLSDHIHMAEGLNRYVRLYRIELNQKGMGAWVRLANEKNLYVLTALLFLWLEHLRNPVLGSEELTNIVLHATDVQETLKRMPIETSTTVDYLLHFVANLDPQEEFLEVILRRIAASLTHRTVASPKNSTMKVYHGFHTTNHEKGKPRRLNDGTLSKLMLVLVGLVERYKNGILVPIEVTITKSTDAKATT